MQKHTNQFNTSYDETKKMAHDSQIVRAKENLKFDLYDMVKSGKFGHTFANSGNPDETTPYEPSHQDFHCLLI